MGRQRLQFLERCRYFVVVHVQKTIKMTHLGDDVINNIYVLRSVDFTMANTASHQQIDHALLTPGQDDPTHTIEVVPRTWSEAARAVGTSTAADVIPDVHGTTTNTDHNSNNYQLTARPVIQHIQHTHQPAKAAPKTLCSEINSCCGCTTIAWIVFATIVMTCAMKYRFTGRIKVGSDIFSKGQRLAWLIVTPFNKDEHVVQKPAQQRTIEDFLLDDIHALNKDCSSIDTLVTTILYKLPVLFGDVVHTLDLLWSNVSFRNAHWSTQRGSQATGSKFAMVTMETLLVDF